MMWSCGSNDQVTTHEHAAAADATYRPSAASGTGQPMVLGSAAGSGILWDSHATSREAKVRRRILVP
jgi:hypothetical protein